MTKTNFYLRLFGINVFALILMCLVNLIPSNGNNMITVSKVLIILSIGFMDYVVGRNTLDKYRS